MSGCNNSLDYPRAGLDGFDSWNLKWVEAFLVDVLRSQLDPFSFLSLRFHRLSLQCL